MVPMHLAFKNGTFVPHNLITVQGSPVPLLKFQITPRLQLNVLWIQEKESRYTCLSEARASHSQRMRAEVSSSAPHLLHEGLLVSPIKWRCIHRVWCPVRRPITTLDCVLLKDIVGTEKAIRPNCDKRKGAVCRFCVKSEHSPSWNFDNIHFLCSQSGFHLTTNRSAVLPISTSVLI